jgi:hypothetical protein
MRILVSFAALFVFAGILAAQENSAFLEVTTPAELENGEPLTDLVAVNVYHRLDGGGYGLLVTVPFDGVPGDTFAYEHEALSDGEHCYYVTSIRAAGYEPDPSNEGCKVIETVRPRAMSDLTITIIVSPPIVSDFPTE